MDRLTGIRAASYIRDGRAPVPRKALTSLIMSRIRAKHTKPELALRAALRKNGYSNYRLHAKNIPGRPDICFPEKRVAIFVHGCFWHSCPYCKPSLPKTHRSFWTEKFRRNKIRDRAKSRLLRLAGWKVIAVWECRLRSSPEKSLARIVRMLVMK
jgi:DNA mismatch endonuclease (patch repair protein)